MFDCTRLLLVPGLGDDDASHSWVNFSIDNSSKDKINNTPTTSVQLELPQGRRMIVPTHSTY